MQGDSDEELLPRVVAGDSAAVRAMIAAKLPRLLALATRMLGDSFEAEDVAQETFVRIWRRAGEWQRGGAKFDTWVHRVAVNLCYDRLRKRREVLMSEPPEIEDEGAAPPAGLAREEDAARRVERALQSIAPRQREAIVLVYYQAMTNTEAAAVMQVSVDALESLLARGRRGLQAHFLKERADE